MAESAANMSTTQTIDETSLVGPDLVRRDSAPNLEPPPASHKTHGGRSTLALERQINELTETFEDYKSTSEARHKSNEGRLVCILEAVTRWDTSSNLSLSRATTPFLTTTSNLVDIKPTFSNPMPTPELITLVSKVVSEARGRVGKKKGGADDNSCKEHARNTFYRMLGIAVASEIRPYFEDDYGEPDTLPAQFVDPDTKYCRPYPHWKSSLAKQVAWIPTYILRFKSTVPNDQSELSVMLRSLTDEQILILLNDGPFKSACAAWRNAKKTDLEIEAMRSYARRYQRCDRKATVRTMYLQTIESLRGPEWEYLRQPGYMSQDESDEDGDLITKRPDYRPRWETNLYEAIQVAERKKATTRPGLPRLHPPRIELVRRPIPHLERGTGNGKVTIRIALCGLSKSWREAYPDEIQKNIHLLNMKETAKPDINSFLAEHPMPEIDSGESVKDESKADEESDSELWAFGTQVEGQVDGGIGYGTDLGMSVGGSMAGEHDGGAGSMLEVEHGSQKHDAMDTAPAQGTEALAGRLGTDIAIDPLLREDTFHRNNRLGPPALSVTKDVFSAPRPVPSFQMPPPPLLDHTSNIVQDEPVVAGGAPVKGKGKKDKQVTIAENPPSTGEAPPETAPKRRGRPPGSKNKPKIT